jgi:4-amino-4-deoxy-L-arabinose transferase-like glycosyltransferase
LVLTFCCLVPFTDKAFFVDDTLFLRAARQIQTDPGNFYGFQINWFGTSQPMTDVFFNPPLTSFYIALVAALAGWGERALHLAFLLIAFAAVWGTYGLARMFCNRPGIAAAATVLTPVFLLCATSVMSDMLLLALWVWSLFFFLSGLQTNAVWSPAFRRFRPGNDTKVGNLGAEPPKGGTPNSNPQSQANSLSKLLLAGLLCGLAVLTKFPGLALLPLMAASAFILPSIPRSENSQTTGQRSRFGVWWVALLLPLLFAAGYETLTHHLYGHGQILSSMKFSSQTRSAFRAGLPERVFSGLCFAGGCYLPVLFYSFWVWSRRTLIIGGLLFGIALIWHPHLTGFSRIAQLNLAWPILFQNALLVLSGVHLLLLAAADLWARRNPTSLVLVLWTGGSFFFAAMMNWTMNGRILLPMAPALGILVARRISSRFDSKGQGAEPRNPRLSPRLAGTMLAGALLSLALTRADYNVAHEERSAANEFSAAYNRPEHTVWFEGHWGFQYYMEQLGAKPLDLLRPTIAPRDVLIIPNSSPNVSRPNPAVATMTDSRSYLPNRYCSTLNPSLGACFYSATRGPLPFAFGKPSPELYLVFKPTAAPP